MKRLHMRTILWRLGCLPPLFSTFMHAACAGQFGAGCVFDSIDAKQRIKQKKTHTQRESKGDRTLLRLGKLQMPAQIARMAVQLFVCAENGWSMWQTRCRAKQTRVDSKRISSQRQERDVALGVAIAEELVLRVAARRDVLNLQHRGESCPKSSGREADLGLAQVCLTNNIAGVVLSGGIQLQDSGDAGAAEMFTECSHERGQVSSQDGYFSSGKLQERGQINDEDERRKAIPGAA